MGVSFGVVPDPRHRVRRGHRPRSTDGDVATVACRRSARGVSAYEVGGVEERAAVLQGGVGGEGSVPGTNIVPMYDKPTDTLVFMAVNMDPAANLETAVLDELSVVATAKG